MNYSSAKAFIIAKLEAELLPIYTYHGLHHTFDVLKVTAELCKAEGINEHDTKLLKTAALFHDSGFTVAPREHEAIGCTIARQYLPDFGYNTKDIEQICGMIMATKIPQSPQNHLEQIICDADLDYLGRDDFFPIGNTLFEELKELGVIKDSLEWNNMQVKFLDFHQYHTDTTKARRNDKKQQHIKVVKQLVAAQ